MDVLRTTNPVIPVTGRRLVNNPRPAAEISLTASARHPIHAALDWEQALKEGRFSSLAEMARARGLTRARVTQIMNLLKLPDELITFLLGLTDPEDIKKYSERRLRRLLLTPNSAPPKGMSEPGKKTEPPFPNGW
jgi:hypothetical protein